MENLYQDGLSIALGEGACDSGVDDWMNTAPQYGSGPIIAAVALMVQQWLTNRREGRSTRTARSPSQSRLRG